eukprot:CAMPEP_0181304406 /NCGR_PEP_ID=MMETSP1101-20121128/9134_1 /TAXON_ID=46948 /ORGANISM="Rhodomonas abbreviata, Strain Caron Lab Isolate" /LENGTH=1010 /DNA_ID=CAMNT_0023410163 /DNA_START=120 /DNA_END=3152 /DNA_ORIENTATION=-
MRRRPCRPLRDTLTVDKAPHITLLDEDGILANTTRLSVSGFVRIRDQRVLRGTGYSSQSSLACKAKLRLPVMGTLQHKKTTATDGPLQFSAAGGFELACGWNGMGPRCCMEVYTNPYSTCPRDACVDLPMDMYTADSSEWFHLSGVLGVGYIKVEISYLDGTGMSNITQWQGEEFYTRMDFPFRIGAQLPFTREGTVMGTAQTDAVWPSYRFLRGDVDEIRLFPNDNEVGDVWENVYNSIDSLCGLSTPQNSMLISMNVFEQNPLELEGMYSTIKAPATVATDSLQYDPNSGFTSGRNAPLAYKITFQDPLPAESCNTLVQNYYRPTCVTYFDRPPMMVTTSQSEVSSGNLSGSNWIATPKAEVVSVDPLKHDVDVTFERRAGIDYWIIPEGRPGISMNLKVLDLNTNDPITIIDPGTGVARQTGKLVSFNYTRYDGPSSAEKNIIPQSMFQYGLLFQPDPLFITADGESEERYRSALNPMADQYVTRDNPNEADNMDAVTITFPDPEVNPDHYECHRDNVGRYKLLCLEWFVPDGRGWNISMRFQQAALDCPKDKDLWGDSIPLTNYFAVLGYDATPEWLSAKEFPKYSAIPRPVGGVIRNPDCPTCRQSDLSPFAQCVEEGAKVRVKIQTLPDGTRASVQIEFIARDRNLDDIVDILPREDPGLPNGAELAPALPAPAEVYQAFDCPPPSCVRPRIYRRRLSFTPSVTQVNQTYRVCFYTRSSPRRGTYEYPGLTQGSIQSALAPPGYPSVWKDRCVNLQVAAPESVFLCGDDYHRCSEAEMNLGGKEFTAGSSECSDEEFTFSVGDGSQFVTNSPDEKYEISMSKDPKNPGPPGLTITSQGSEFIDGKIVQTYRIEWTPQVGVDDNREGYRTCMIAHDEFYMSTQTRCFTAFVRKCKYCLKEGETMEAVGRRFGVDWLQIYLANPHLEDPDDIPPSNRLINLGVMYTVRAGDYLDLLSQRFFQPVSELKRINVDVAEDGSIFAGMQMCVMPPVCSIDCLYGTDCYVY